MADRHDHGAMFYSLLLNWNLNSDKMFFAKQSALFLYYMIFFVRQLCCSDWAEDFGGARITWEKTLYLKDRLTGVQIIASAIQVRAKTQLHDPAWFSKLRKTFWNVLSSSGYLASFTKRTLTVLKDFELRVFSGKGCWKIAPAEISRAWYSLLL